MCDYPIELSALADRAPVASEMADCSASSAHLHQQFNSLELPHSIPT